MMQRVSNLNSMSRAITELTGSNAIATIKGKICASHTFTQFLNVAAATNIDDIEEQELCDPALLRRYATFLVDHYFVSGEDERLMCDSAKQYLSGVYNVIKTRYPSNSNYTAKGSEWYKKLRKDLKSQITLRCIELVKGSTSKSLNVERNISHNHASNQERRWHQSPFQSDGKC